MSNAYIGRFAPSPTGPLHLGSLVAAMAAALDARAHGGRLLLRIDDVDATRIVPGAAAAIIHSLQVHGLEWDGEVRYTSQSEGDHDQAFAQLKAAGLVYPCACTRSEIAARSPHSRSTELRYPGTCRNGLGAGRTPRAWRLRVPTGIEAFVDRAAGTVAQDVLQEVGDFVLRRADGLWSYHLAIVVDDGRQQVTDIVRGNDLLEVTARQRVLQRLLGLPQPRSLHVPVVLGPTGEKLSKQSGASALNDLEPLPALQRAARHLGLTQIDPALADDKWHSLPAFWDAATRVWAARWT